ncbi:MAG: TetR/AcrR family transcriptional regulator [Lachnospiraceae bacterium]|nr:TetR/AcrR family transcriptional regulator [Lachnospiraceae bacterium]
MKEQINKKVSNHKFHKDTFDKTTEERRKKVLEVAIDEFASKGYSATSINDISKKSGISIGALYSYFASKEDLFLSIVNTAYYTMEEILNDVSENSKDIFDCTERMLIASRKFAIQYSKLNQIYLDITTQALTHLSVRLSNKLEMITPQILTKFINAAKDEGIIRKDMDERVAAFCLDNIFTMYQFSFSSDYYRERLKIYIGEEKFNDIDSVEKSILKFIRSAIE